MICLKNISKKYDDKVIFDNLSLSIENEKITVILGESGSGKTTLLNIISKQTNFDGEVCGVNLPISLVAQRDCLVKNLSVKENLQLIKKDVDIMNALNMVNLSGHEGDYIKNLSGGEARRVVIARALIFEHKTLIMDEPFSSLDLATKYNIIEKIKKTQRENKSTIICVTHDIDEAVSLADNIVVLKNGKIIFEIKNDKKDVFDKIKAVLKGDFPLNKN